MTRKALSRLWKSPRSAGQIEGRQVDFLELFYDLIYVVLIAEIAHILAIDVTLESFQTFLFLYIMIWFLWLNAAVYHNLHGFDDLRTRIFVFIQIGILAVMTVFIHDAMGELSTGFALAYAAFVALLAFLWWRTEVHDPAHRLQTITYITTYPIAVILFVISIFVATPFRFYMWIVALLIMLILPSVISGIGQRVEYITNLNIASPSLRERFKLFTIIVFGEAIIGVVAGLSVHHQLDIAVGITGGLGLILVFALWWIYFDAASDHPVKQNYSWFWTWGIIHLPIWLGITTVGPAVLNIIALHEGETMSEGVLWLLTGAIALTLISVAGFLQTLDVRAEFKDACRNCGLIFTGLAVVVLLLGYFGTFFSTIMLLIFLAILLVIPILFSLYLQAQVIEEQESDSAD